MARRPSLSNALTFGGRVPASVGGLVAAVVLATLIAALDPQKRLAQLAALSPVSVVRGELWRLVTWPFIETNALSLLFGGFMIWSTGQQLAYAWSERRFVARFAAYTLAGGAGTALLGSVWAPASVPYLGIWPVALALLVAWAMLFPDRQTSFFGVLPMTGKTLALIAAGLTVLSGLIDGGVNGLGSVAPHLFAMGLAWLQGRPRAGRSGRGAIDPLRRWWAEREQKRRTKHLKVVRKNGSDGRSDWRN